MRVLIVDDDPRLSELISKVLHARGILSTIEHDGASAIATATDTLFDIILLDLILPDMSGIQVGKELAQRSITSKIIIMTIQSDILNTITCLNSFADDFLTKPFNIEELISRMNAVLRRTVMPIKQSDMFWKEYTIDTKQCSVIHNDSQQEIRFTLREFDIFRHLVDRRGFIVSKTDLEQSTGETSSRAIDTHIFNIRKKMHELSNVDHIITVRGRGYMVQP